MDQTEHQPHTTADSETAYESDAKWLTFKELAVARGISKASATSLVRRHGWRRQRDNEGRVRALVPLSWASAETVHETDNEGDDQPTGRADTRLMAGALAALETAVMSLTKRAEVAEQRADRAELATTELRAEAEADIRELRAHATALQTMLAGQTEALQRLQALEAAETARQARGLLARLRAAVRGR